MTTVVHTWPYGRFLEIQSHLRRSKLHKAIEGSNFQGSHPFTQNPLSPPLFCIPSPFSSFYIVSPSPHPPHATTVNLPTSSNTSTSPIPLKISISSNQPQPFKFWWKILKPNKFSFSHFVAPSDWLLKFVTWN